MKICLYTLSDFKSGSIDCIDLLLKSITFDLQVDFFILTNIKDSQKYKQTKFNVIIDNTNDEYIGYIKYSPILPENYDYYIYLDSDILYFGNISNLIDESKSFTIVKHNSLIKNNDWYYFPYLNNQNDIVKIQQSQAINAGSFCFRHDRRSDIMNIYSIYHQYKKNNIHHDVRLEQSIFNLILNIQSNYTLSNCYDITHMVELFAANKNPIKNKTLYHFCGFTNEMLSKYHHMKKFYDQYKRIDS